MVSTTATIAGITSTLAPVSKQATSIETLLFGWLDYSLFFIMLGLSAAIGVYFGFFGKKQDNTMEYLLGGKAMSIFPIAMSLIASHLSGITVLGIPAEIYNYGTQYWMCLLTGAITSVVIVTVYLPVFYKLQLTSSYEYLKLRFDTRLRIMASFLYALSNLLYIPCVIYVPALAFSQVTGISIHFITPITCVVCIFYTTLGGLKAVVWTDTLQFSIMIGAMATLVTLGTKSAGGFMAVWNTADKGDRIEFFNMNLDPTERTTFWGIVVGMTVSWISYLGVTQSSVQRFLSVPTIKAAKTSVLYLCIGILSVKCFTCFMGLLMYARYFDCDPLASGRIERSDQILPFYVMDVAGRVPGLPGLFIAGVFCAALSTMSSGMNTLAGTIYEDFIGPYMPPTTTEKRASNIMKVIVVVIGTVCTSMVFIVERLGGIIQLSYSLGGITSGPLLGLFTLGMLCPKANSKGALAGSIASLISMTIIVVGGQYYVAKGYKHIPKHASIEGCDFEINTNLTSTTTAMPNINDGCQEELPNIIFRISFYYYALIGCVIFMVVGIVVSYLTRHKDDEPTHPDFLSPVVYWMLPKDQKYIPRDYQSVGTPLQVITYKHSLEKEKEAMQQLKQFTAK